MTSIEYYGVKELSDTGYSFPNIHVFYNVSVLITTYLALQKCCCVVMPFKFKNMFTPKKNNNCHNITVCYNFILLHSEVHTYG